MRPWFWPQADNAVTQGEGGGFILPASLVLYPSSNAARGRLFSGGNIFFFALGRAPQCGL